MRHKPRTDGKVLTSWNGLALKAYVDTYRVFGTKNYFESTLKNAHFIKNHQITENGALYHNFKDEKSSVNGFSEDYATIIEAFIALYEVSLDEEWLNLPNELMDYTLTHFFDSKNSMFYFTSHKENQLISRKMEILDKAIPSSNSILTKNLFKLSHYYANEAYALKSKQMLSNLVLDIEQTPTGYTNWLDLYLNYAYPCYKVAISGEEAKEKIEKLNQNYLPNILITDSTTESTLPLLENRFNKEDTYIYVFVNSACMLPQQRVDDALKQLE